VEQVALNRHVSLVFIARVFRAELSSKRMSDAANATTTHTFMFERYAVHKNDSARVRVISN